MAVEAALVVPVLMLLVFGMIEMSFALRDYAGVSSYARAGARIASTGADAGPADASVCSATDPELPPCAPASTPELAQQAADTIARAGTVMPREQIQYILVYEANADGFPGPDGNRTMPTTCANTTNCVMFRWQVSREAFRYANGSWISSQINACFPGTRANPIDRVGVHVETRKPMLTGLFGDGISMSDRAVMTFEPLEYDRCAPGQHD